VFFFLRRVGHVVQRRDLTGELKECTSVGKPGNERRSNGLRIEEAKWSLGGGDRHRPWIKDLLFEETRFLLFQFFSPSTSLLFPSKIKVESGWEQGNVDEVIKRKEEKK
jgi:hypothetical protein